MDTPPRARRARDPGQRRREIVAAAVDLITESGPAALTHRLVADRAGVSPGSVTAYFATLDDLRTAALESMAGLLDEEITRIGTALAATDDVVGVVVDWTHAYLSDSRLVRSDVAVATAAVADDDLLVLTRRWFDGMVAVLTPHVGAARAVAVTVFLDGATWHALHQGRPMDRASLAASLAALTGREVR
ncbi:TetR family transcriptional regulator [Saccharothrix violaceirubra]|uniref:DNA-binding transcriptional regulator YbjK n=1 Tax=Saccharothrix violaceirubra TaxID=413306 RepID=A0A7W7T3N1_9PSEU|nr:TetR family transcriptional regulator [Saccharothrix violaceirubra]MBB4965934.1 DNA-binding transcriptional regulator YbjK [Saccharothrix violaceirubra]